MSKKKSNDFSRTIAINYAVKLWSMVAGLISVWFITQYTSAIDQGFYYTINSILALQIFIELGFNYAVVRIIGNKLGKLGGDFHSNRLQISANPEVSLLCKRFVRQSIAISIVAAIVLVPLGIVFFSKINGNTVTFPFWLSLVVFSAFNVFLNTILAIIEGLGFVLEVATIRLWQSTSLSIFLWGALWAGVGLNALIWANAASIIVVIFLIQKNFFWILGVFQKKISNKLPFDEIKLLQNYTRKIAVSGISGYLIFQVFTPLLSLYSGPIEAGRFAMTLQIINSLNIFGLVPLTSNASRLANLIGSGDKIGSMLLFRRICVGSTAIMLIICAVMVGVLSFAQYLDLSITERFLPIWLFILMLVSALANHLVFSFATYLRSFLDDPFWILSVVSAIFGMVGAYALIIKFGYAGAVYVYFLNSTVIGLGGAIIIFKKARNG